MSLTVSGSARQGKQQIGKRPGGYDGGISPRVTNRCSFWVVGLWRDQGVVPSLGLSGGSTLWRSRAQSPFTEHVLAGAYPG
jgi:hypothetical protein